MLLVTQDSNGPDCLLDNSQKYVRYISLTYSQITIGKRIFLNTFDRD